MPRRQWCSGRVGTDFGVRRWRSLDPCGCCGVSLSVGVHIFALYAIAVHCLTNSLPAAILYFGLYVPVALLAVSSLGQAWRTNPGAVPMGARPLTIVRRQADGTMTLPRRGTRRCHKCQDNFKPPRAHHDSVTGRCIVKFDHFCPWVGNAVGALNHKFFCLFLLYTASACLLSLVFLGLRVIHCGYVTALEEDPVQLSSTAGNGNGHHRQPHHHPQQQQHQQNQNNNDIQHHPDDRLLESIQATPEATTAYLYEECHTFYASHVVVALLICSVVFLIFTCSMGCEQIDAISTGQGKIARMQSARAGSSSGGPLQRVTEEFNEMFGGDKPECQWHWFNPYRNVEYPRNMKKVVLGYDWNDAWDSTVPFPDDDDDVEDGGPERGASDSGGGGGGGSSSNSTDTATTKARDRTKEDGGSELARLERERAASSDAMQRLPLKSSKQQEFELVRRSSSEGSSKRAFQRKQSPSRGGIV